MSEPRRKKEQQHFKNYTALQEASIEQLLEIDGLGDIIAYSVKTTFLTQPSVQELIQELQDSGVNMTHLCDKDDSAASGHVLSGKTFGH